MKDDITHYNLSLILFQSKNSILVQNWNTDKNCFSLGTKLMYNDGFNQITRAVFNRVVVGFKQT